MPSITLTISLWWPVAAVAAAVWFFGVVAPTYRRLDSRKRRHFRGNRPAYERWRRRSLFLFGVLAGPVYWVPWAFDSLRGALKGPSNE